MSAPRLIQVLTASKHYIELHEEVFSQILLQEDIKNRSVAIIAVAGLLDETNIIRDYFLRYLYAQYRKKGVTNWIEERMWSDIFTYDYETGEKIAIVLLDTQRYGENFDNDGNNEKNSSSIFVLSTLISSIHCFTLTESSLKKESEWPKTILNYGKVFNASTKKKPLQKLVFIEQNSGEYKKCRDGTEILQKVLKSSLEETSSIEQELESCFDDISYYTLSSYDLVISNLEDLIPSLLSPKNIVVKKLNGSTIRAEAFTQIIKSYMSPFEENKVLDGQNIFTASADASNILAVIRAKQAYSFVMGFHVQNSNNQNLKACHKDTYNRGVIPTESFTEKCIYARRLAKQCYIDAMEKAVSNGPITEECFKMKHVFAEKKAKQLFKDQCGIEEIRVFDRGHFVDEYFNHVA